MAKRGRKIGDSKLLKLLGTLEQYLRETGASLYFEPTQGARGPTADDDGHGEFILTEDNGGEAYLDCYKDLVSLMKDIDLPSDNECFDDCQCDLCRMSNGTMSHSFYED